MVQPAGISKSLRRSQKFSGQWKSDCGQFLRKESKEIADHLFRSASRRGHSFGTHALAQFIETDDIQSLNINRRLGSGKDLETTLPSNRIRSSATSTSSSSSYTF